MKDQKINANSVLENLKSLKGGKSTNESRQSLSENDSVDMCIKIGGILKWHVEKKDSMYDGAASASKEVSGKRMVITSFEHGQLQLCLETDDFEPIDNVELEYFNIAKFFQDPVILAPLCLAAFEKAKHNNRF